MQKPILFRRRIIPEECILLKDDEILFYNMDIIVTKWNTLHPKKKLHHGYSCYFLNEGYKVSKFLYEDNRLLYWYCDIIDYEYRIDTGEYIVRDLLADVIVYPDGFVKVVDLDEFEKALENGSISFEDVKKALRSLDKLLKIIYNGEFETLKKEIETRE